MKNRRLAYRASLVCLAGGAIQVVYGLLAIPFGPYTESTGAWDELLWALANVGMIGGALGLLALGGARLRWLAMVGAALSVLGNMLRIVVSALLILLPSQTAYVPLILTSIALLILGMVALGIATLSGKQLTGWQAWTPLLAGGFTLIPVAIYSVNQFLHFIVLGLWGLPWLLVGYVVFRHASDRGQATLASSPAAAATP
jgi:hypothetical protein